jgi:hypothetical protein
MMLEARSDLDIMACPPEPDSCHKTSDTNPDDADFYSILGRHRFLESQIVII